jgi:hypothetical protein
MPFASAFSIRSPTPFLTVPEERRMFGVLDKPVPSRTASKHDLGGSKAFDDRQRQGSTDDQSGLEHLPTM